MHSLMVVRMGRDAPHGGWAKSVAIKPHRLRPTKMPRASHWPSVVSLPSFSLSPCDNSPSEFTRESFKFQSPGNIHDYDAPPVFWTQVQWPSVLYCVHANGARGLVYGKVQPVNPSNRSDGTMPKRRGQVNNCLYLRSDININLEYSYGNLQNIAYEVQTLVSDGRGLDVLFVAPLACYIDMPITARRRALISLTSAEQTSKV